MQNTIQGILIDSSNLKRSLAGDPAFINQVERGVQLLRRCRDTGGTIFSCGNGGSACDAMHLTEELVARFKRDRPGIRAIHFADPGILTCWSNDYDYESAFERQTQTFCGKNDLLVGLSTSGNSKNVLRAVQAAKKLGTTTIGLLGKDGGLLSKEVDLPLIVPAKLTERIQEVHITIIHIWMELLES